MSVLGTSIGNYLKGIGGQFSVELPRQLEYEAYELVKTCNSPQQPAAALLVSDSPTQSSQITTTSWSQLLSWRTGHDRVFVWIRGTGQPDSSFESVVRKFIDGQFPGGNSSILTLKQLAGIALDEIWRKNGLSPNTSPFDVFSKVLNWIFNMAGYTFEQDGNGPIHSWSDQFLVYCAKLLDNVDGLVSSSLSGGNLQPITAWDMFRLGGLPLPLRLHGAVNPVLNPPEFSELVTQEELAQTWNKTCIDYILSPGGSTLLFSVLDRVLAARGSSTPNTWWNFNWPTIPPSPPHPSLLVIQDVFLSASTQAWSEVTFGDLEEVMSQLGQPAPLSVGPDPLVKPLLGAPDSMILATRNGTVTHLHTTQKWRARVVISGLQLAYRGDWGQLFVQQNPPSQSQVGDAWVQPSSLVVEVTLGSIRCLNVQPSVGTGGYLSATFDIEVEYSTGRDQNDLEGRWNPSRRLKLKFPVRQWDGTSWSAQREIRESIEFYVPSPFELTFIAVDPRGKGVFCPSRDDRYSATMTPSTYWTPTSSTDLQLPERGVYSITVYDGRLDPGSLAFLPVVTHIDIQSPQPVRLVAPLTNTNLFTGNHFLDEGDTIEAISVGTNWTVATITVSEQTRGPSSGILAAIRNQSAAHTQPSQEARSSLLGQYQDRVMEMLQDVSTGHIPNSLFQFIVPTNTEVIAWPNHDGTPHPQFVGNPLQLAWIGNGPSQTLINATEWKEFNKSLQSVLSQLGLNSGPMIPWISGLDPSLIDFPILKHYLNSHRALVSLGRTLSPQDEFWAKYPLSCFIVEGQPGASQGRLYCILMSPLHPVRLSWAFGVSRLGRSLAASSGLVRRLLGLLEGWDIPACGFAVGPGQSSVLMVAVPLDPGAERDFVGWSALAAVEANGLPALPPIAVGLPLPWSGRTGINDNTVARAVHDYLWAHPYSTSINLDLRSVSPSGRSQQVDKTVLSIMGAPTSKIIDQLRGGTRVWDSRYRMGTPPSRDELTNIRLDNQSRAPFEWTQYDPVQPPDADLALIEDASVNLSLITSQSLGVLGPVPVRRFSPTSIHQMGIDEHIALSSGEDLLGLSDLLELLESEPKTSHGALRCSTSTGALGLGGKSEWEVLGTFHLDPVQLAQFVSSLPTTMPRVLWEWHPSWLRERTQQEPDLSNRPYFVIARVPPSISVGLSKRHGLNQQQTQELLSELGKRGIGLASLVATEGTHEAAALGFFSALRLLTPETDITPQPTWQNNIVCAQNGNLIYAILPIDPLASFIEALAGQSFSRRADLLFISACHSQNGTTFCLFPVEVKHHGTPSNPSSFPAHTDSELNRARSQLKETQALLSLLAGNLNAPATSGEGYLYRVGFSALVELAMSISPSATSAQERSSIISNILHGKTSVNVGQPLLLWFGVGATSAGGAAFTSNAQAVSGSSSVIQEIFIDPIRVPSLLWINGDHSGSEPGLRIALDNAVSSCLASCSLSEQVVPINVKGELEILLGQSRQPLIHPVNVEETTETSITNVEPEIPEDASQESPTDVGLEPEEVAQVPEGASSTGEEAIEGEIGEDELSTATSEVSVPPGYFAGWTEYTNRWAILGKLPSSTENFALDLDHPKGIGIFGYMGTGKSYLVGAIAESAVASVPRLNSLPFPLAVVIFNYRRNFRERFELSSLAFPNDNPEDIESLNREFGVSPRAVGNIHILRLPQLPVELNARRQEEYEGISSSELFFRVTDLDIEDWELLMGQPSSNHVYAQVIRQTLEDLSYQEQVSIANLSQRIASLSGSSRAAAQLRLDFAQRYISQTSGSNFQDLVRPGRILIVDLRKPMFDKTDAMRFFLVCANQVRRVQGAFNKLVIFDEAHEYLSDMFADKIDEGLRYMRHNGMTYLFATQDVRSIPQNVSRWIGTKFVFGLGSKQNMDDMVRFAPEFREHNLLNLGRGECFVSSSYSLNGIFHQPQLLRVRPRITRHGGTTRIFSFETH